MHVPVCL